MRSLLLVTMMLGACAVEEVAPDGAALDRIAPLPAYVPFAFSQIVPGFPAGGAWIEGAVGSRVTFFASANGLGSGPCVPGGGPCLGLARPVVTLGSVRTGRDGVAHWAGIAPRNLPAGSQWSFQAVGYDGGGVYQISDVVQRPIGYAFCPLIYSPVCAADRDTYSNECDANAYGWPVLFAGTCP